MGGHHSPPQSTARERYIIWKRRSERQNACWRADDLLQFVEDVLTMAGDLHSEPLHPSVYRTGVADIQRNRASSQHTGIREEVVGPFICVYLFRGNALSDRDGGTVCEVRRVMRRTQFSSSLNMWRQVTHLTTNEDWRLVEYWTTGIPPLSILRNAISLSYLCLRTLIELRSDHLDRTLWPECIKPHNTSLRCRPVRYNGGRAYTNEDIEM
ncbi:hypothetical protein PROFUN_13655 [Planoprotostelium fungivorum]|uniref:Uncharacterized protein n=1 Tax=Planoprotostelium fungivorum TaxID=1890364 RepID=A0A2P6N3D9_9EUKA|nr:hypothetical protein PROFUN_13655 [Planoprotostelium fungivorum]